MPVKKKTVQDILHELRSKDNLAVGAVLDVVEEEAVIGWPTGNIALDYVTSVGGFPQGRITELYGPPSSGKTTAALQAMARVQEFCKANGGYVMFLDFEFALDLEYCEKLGLDVEHESFIYMQPDTFEQGANAFRKLLDTGELRMAVFDSVAAMVTQKEIDEDTGYSTVADRAKMMHQFCRQIRAKLQRTGTSAVFLNHTMELLDASPMGQKLARQGVKRETQPGGKALPFYSSLRIAFKQIGNIRTSEINPLTNEKDDLIRSTNVEARAVKNKVGDPFRSAQLRVRFGRGFSQEFSIYKIVTAYQAVKRDKTGGHFFPADPEWLTPPLLAKVKKGEDTLKIRGEETVLKLMEASPDWRALLEERAKELLAVHTTPEPTDEDEEAVSVDAETGEVL